MRLFEKYFLDHEDIKYTITVCFDSEKDEFKITKFVSVFTIGLACETRRNTETFSLNYDDDFIAALTRTGYEELDILLVGECVKREFIEAVNSLGEDHAYIKATIRSNFTELFETKDEEVDAASSISAGSIDSPSAQEVIAEATDALSPTSVVSPSAIEFDDTAHLLLGEG